MVIDGQEGVLRGLESVFAKILMPQLRVLDAKSWGDLVKQSNTRQEFLNNLDIFLQILTSK